VRLKIKEVRESNDLLNLLMENMSSAVFLTDTEMKLQDFNNTLQKIFSRPEQEMLNQRCGNAMGCAFAVEEKALCGESSNCPNCVLRSSILKALDHGQPTDRERLHRQFYVGETPVEKHFQFSVRRIMYEERPIIMVIIDDLTELESQRLALLEKQKRLDEDLKAAAGIQQSLLPQSFPEVRNCSFGSKFVPSAYVGGDIYNVFRMDDKRVVLYMIDVCGHGVASSLVTVSVSQMLHPSGPVFHQCETEEYNARDSLYSSPSNLLQVLDQHYPFEKFDTYFTITYMVLDVRTGELLYSSAGHPFPLVVRVDGRLELLEEGGCLIGLSGMVPYEEGRTILRPGDRLVIYTDGITEYFDRKGNMFGEERFYRWLVEGKSQEAQAMLDGLYSEMMVFGRDKSPDDDISIVAMDYHGALLH
jgi:sigma-B regulation protein RsbU (phosphoserine phosphatase)